MVLFWTLTCQRSCLILVLTDAGLSTSTISFKPPIIRLRWIPSLPARNMYHAVLRTPYERTALAQRAANREIIKVHEIQQASTTISYSTGGGTSGSATRPSHAIVSASLQQTPPAMPHLRVAHNTTPPTASTLTPAQGLLEYTPLSRVALTGTLGQPGPSRGAANPVSNAQVRINV